ncbi:hypothetical protein BGZ63DRAFT_424866 [Mariannaea sp. PMI_226]|nr:hypothetical protein BGZ63DRAFT_424866 [Mariannaea sp. PMI_226]
MSRSILIAGLMAVTTLAQSQFAIDGWEYVGCAKTDLTANFPLEYTFWGHHFRPQDCQMKCNAVFRSGYAALGDGCTCNDPRSFKLVEIEVVEPGLCNLTCIPGRNDMGYCGGGGFDVVTPPRYSLYKRVDTTTAGELKKRGGHEVNGYSELDPNDGCPGGKCAVVASDCKGENCETSDEVVDTRNDQDEDNSSGSQHRTTQNSMQASKNIETVATQPAEDKGCSGTNCEPLLTVADAAQLATGSIAFIAMTGALAYCLM